MKCKFPYHLWSDNLGLSHQRCQWLVRTFHYQVQSQLCIFYIPCGILYIRHNYLQSRLGSIHIYLIYRLGILICRLCIFHRHLLLHSQLEGSCIIFICSKRILNRILHKLFCSRLLTF